MRIRENLAAPFIKRKGTVDATLSALHCAVLALGDTKLRQFLSTQVNRIDKKQSEWVARSLPK
jgi:hypothetical protein